MEIVRFEVPPERQAELVGGHDDARKAIAAASPPGALWSRLGRIGETGWVEIVAWGSRAVFDGALERAPKDPVAAEWFGLAEPGWTILIGEAMAGGGDPPPPPREGELELAFVWDGRQGAGAGDPEAAPWSLLVAFDGRAWIDPVGWTDRDPLSVRITARTAAAPAADDDAGAVHREVARIVHAVDSLEGQAAS